MKANTLLFIPDISGFTKFVSSTDEKKTQKVVKDLIELIIQSDELGLTVVEIEGDAVFFCKQNKLPTLKEINRQVRKTFSRFQKYLKRGVRKGYLPLRCLTREQGLSLKFFVHVAECRFMRIHNKKVVFGQDVILIHRLMKNGIPHKEYVLYTETALQKLAGHLTQVQVSDLNFERGTEKFDHLQEVNYMFLPLTKMKNGILASLFGSICLKGGVRLEKICQFLDQFFFLEFFRNKVRIISPNWKNPLKLLL